MFDTLVVYIYGMYIYIYSFKNIYFVKYFAFLTETDEAFVKKAKFFTKYMCF